MDDALLQRLGINGNERLMYKALLEMGKSGIARILEKTPLKRGTAYNTLYALIEKGLVEESTTRGKKYFLLAHPRHLEDLLRTQEADVDRTKEQLADSLPRLVSTYNLTMHRPNVRFYEGEEGTKAFMDDSLTAKTDILQYHDPKAVAEHIAKLNEAYIRTRIRRGIKKRMLVPRTTELEGIHQRRGSAYARLTETRQLPVAHLSSTVLAIYDEKTAYLTVTENSTIGVIIDDKEIASMHRMLFEMTWKAAAPRTAGAKETKP